MAEPLGLVIDRANAYGGTIHHWHDGDTAAVLVWDALLQARVLLDCRLRGINAPELTAAGGVEVRDAVWAAVPPDTAVTIRDVGPYPRPGHVTCTVSTPSIPDLSVWLLERGFAVRYSGVGPRPEVPWPPVPPAAP